MLSAAKRAVACQFDFGVPHSFARAINTDPFVLYGSEGICLKGLVFFGAFKDELHSGFSGDQVAGGD